MLSVHVRVKQVHASVISTQVKGEGEGSCTCAGIFERVQGASRASLERSKGFRQFLISSNLSSRDRERG